MSVSVCHVPSTVCRLPGLLRQETDKFAQLEASIKAAKADAFHKRRIAELSGGAWDGLENMRLKKLRLKTANAGLTAAIAAEKKARTDEAEYMRELAIEKNRVL